jgi:hypothetical protein
VSAAGDAVVGPWLIGIGLVVAFGFVALSLVVPTDGGLMIVGALIFIGLALYGVYLVLCARADRRRLDRLASSPRDS